ncbi:hypothetical protein ACIGKL_07895 [Pseudomonas sp. NPDC077186]|uniref:hypothetical protein n=1 Tax=Pseudomonas sp. NPDC077186 TaxID=3364421 RepID=UPI0037C7716E
MKKISLAVAGLLFSGLASAVQLPSTGTVFQTVCSNLNEDVRINLTTGVVAGVSCTNARVALAACHTGGMQKSRSVGQKTITVQVDDGSGNMVDQQQTVSCSVGTADPDCATVAVTGAAVPSSTTNAGTVNNQYPGTGACTVGVAETVANGLN